MKKALKLPFQFDADQMLQELQSISNTFQPIENKYTGDSLSGTHLIVPSRNGEANNQGETFSFTQELKECSYLQEVLNTFQCDKFTFRVQNLRSGGMIKKHKDGDKGLRHRWIRLNIPVKTNEQVFTYYGGERILMKNGECWLPNVIEEHWMENRSEETRWLLLMDCDLNDWWKEILNTCGLNLESVSKYQYQSLEELENIKTGFLAHGFALESEWIQEVDFELERRGFKKK
jgi:aspartyl/asparaginyl beta-hydroxylase (cupin superfamily)